jgi:hypothetical protein
MNAARQQQLSAPPSGLSSSPKVARDVPEKGEAFSSLSWERPASLWLIAMFSQRAVALANSSSPVGSQQLWRRLSFAPWLHPMPTLLRVFFSTWLISSGLLAAAFEVDGSFFAGFWIS